MTSRRVSLLSAALLLVCSPVFAEPPSVPPALLLPPAPPAASAPPAVPPAAPPAPLVEVNVKTSVPVAVFVQPYGQPYGVPVRQEVPVDVKADRDGGILEAREVFSGYWTRICSLPCAAKLDPSMEFRISGSGVIDTKAFRIPRSARGVSVDAKLGSTWGRALGITLTSLGGLGILSGGSMSSERSPAGGVVALGLGALIAGIALTVANGSSLDISTRLRPASADPDGFPALIPLRGADDGMMRF